MFISEVNYYSLVNKDQLINPNLIFATIILKYWENAYHLNEERNMFYLKFYEYNYFIKKTNIMTCIKIIFKITTLQLLYVTLYIGVSWLIYYKD